MIVHYSQSDCKHEVNIVFHPETNQWQTLYNGVNIYEANLQIRRGSILAMIRIQSLKNINVWSLYEAD